jgi:hypothetical protein
MDAVQKNLGMTNKQDITVNKVVVPLGYARVRLCGTARTSEHPRISAPYAKAYG